MNLTPEEYKRLTKKLRFRQSEITTNMFAWGMVDPLDLAVYENMKELSEVIENGRIEDKCPQEDHQNIRKNTA